MARQPGGGGGGASSGGDGCGGGICGGGGGRGGGDGKGSHPNWPSALTADACTDRCNGLTLAVGACLVTHFPGSGHYQTGASDCHLPALLTGLRRQVAPSETERRPQQSTALIEWAANNRPLPSETLPPVRELMGVAEIHVVFRIGPASWKV